MAFPDIQNPSKISESHNRAKLRSQFEAGYVHQRPKWTRSRKKFTLDWNLLPEADLITLLNDFDTNQGSSFSWTHPTRDTTYTVMYSGDAVEYDLSYESVGKYYSVSIGLEEL